MLTLNDGRKELYQWDTGRTATVDIECDVVHFANLKYGESLAVEVKGGEVAIPNKLLTSGEPIYCWAFVKDVGGAYTKKEQTFAVIKRAKPSDYVYTETEVISIEQAVNDALEKAKESGEFKGDTGAKGDKGDKGDTGAQGIQGEKGADGVSPTVATDAIAGGTKVTITDQDGAHEFNVMDGKKGDMPPIAQTPGDSETAVMSQKATTAEINALKSDLIQYAKLESKNIYDVSKSTDGGYINRKDGTIISNANRSYTDYIEVAENQNYTISAYRDSGVAVAIEEYAFYDNNKDFVSGYASQATGELTYQVPIGAKYVRHTLVTAYKDRYQLEKGTVRTEFEEYNPVISKDNIPLDYIRKELIYVPETRNNHRVLVVNPSGADYLCGITTEDAFSGGYLVEGCSFDGFVLNANEWKNCIDAVVFYDLIITENENYVSLVDVVNAMRIYWQNGVKFIFTRFGSGDIHRYANNGTHTTVSIRDGIFGGGIIVDSTKSVSNATLIESNESPFANNVLRSGMGTVSNTLRDYSWSAGYTYYSPIQAEDANGNICRCTLYNPKGVFLMNYGGLVSGNPEASPASKYAKLNIVLDAMLGIENCAKLSLDMIHGKKISAYGFDGDVTTQPETYQKLLDCLGKKRRVGISLRSKLMTPELSKLYRNLDGNYSLVSHTGSHYADRTTYDKEEHIVDSKGLVKLNNPNKAQILSVTDSNGNSYAFQDSHWARVAPTGMNYFADYTTTSPIELKYGRLKFATDKIGTVVKITYTALTNEFYEAIGSLEELRNCEGAITDNAIYMTMGSNSVHPFTKVYADKNDVVLCDQFNGIDCNRMEYWLKKNNDKLVFPVSPLFKTGINGSVIRDSALFKNTYEYNVNTLIPSAMSYCEEYCLPFEWYDHDIVLSDNYETSVWNDSRGIWDSSWKKDTYEETATSVLAMYKALYDLIETVNPIWMTREDYCRYYTYLNKGFEYNVSIKNSTHIVTGKNESIQKLKGVTFKLNISNEPTEIILNNKKIKSYSYSDGRLLVWFDVEKGEKFTLSIT